jgi:hypothetical protein
VQRTVRIRKAALNCAWCFHCRAIGARYEFGNAAAATIPITPRYRLDTLSIPYAAGRNTVAAARTGLWTGALRGSTRASKMLRSEPGRGPPTQDRTARALGRGPTLLNCAKVLAIVGAVVGQHGTQTCPRVVSHDLASVLRPRFASKRSCRITVVRQSQFSLDHFVEPRQNGSISSTRAARQEHVPRNAHATARHDMINVRCLPAPAQFSGDKVSAWRGSCW